MQGKPKLFVDKKSLFIDKICLFVDGFWSKIHLRQRAARAQTRNP